jgi:nucleotide-binding universal stress UspA family protein
MYKRILVPLDGSDTASRGFEEAVALAREMKAQLVLLHAVDAFPVLAEMGAAATFQTVQDGLRQFGEDLLSRARSTAADHGVAADMRLVEASTGRAADVINAMARDLDCDLIVMGTHGRRGFSHLMMGSDAAAVARASDVPVLLVRHPEARRR